MSGLDDLRADEERMISKFGHAVRYVFPVEAGGSAFAYTAGRGRAGRADLLITGNLPPQITHSILNQVAGQIDTGELELENDAFPSDKVLSGFSCWMLRVEDLERAQMFGSLAYGATAAYQIVWPDADGLFPWEDGYSTAMAQPVYGVAARQ